MSQECNNGVSDGDGVSDGVTVIPIRPCSLVIPMGVTLLSHSDGDGVVCTR
jgi:hypothetical protein